MQSQFNVDDQPLVIRRRFFRVRTSTISEVSVPVVLQDWDHRAIAESRRYAGTNAIGKIVGS
jgi:hypothetical protein